MTKLSRNQLGQSLVLGVVLCGAGVLAWLLMLQLGERVHDKSSLHRGADAASYSAAIIQARALNMHAYLNRAQLAHQLAIAHIVGAATAAQFRSKMARQAQRRNPPPSLIGAFFGPQHSTAYLAAVSSGMGDPFSPHTFRHAFLRHERAIHHVLAQVRKNQIQHLERQRKHAIEQVLIRNVGHSGSAMRGESLRQLGLSIEVLRDDSKGYVVQHSANDPVWRNFLTHLVGQYGFLDMREQTHRNLWLVNARCPLRRHELRRRGKLELGADGQWHAEETLSFHALRHNRIIGCYHREYPMGWAVLSTQKGHLTDSVSSVGTTDFARRPFWRWARAQGGPFWNIFGGRENPLAQSWGTSGSIKWPSKGLGHYAQITEGRAQDPVRFGLRVKQRLKTNATLTSVSAAQVYFAPPASPSDYSRIDDQKRGRNSVSTVTGSLFEPYWRVTLIPNLHVLDQTQPLQSSRLTESAP